MVLTCKSVSIISSHLSLSLSPQEVEVFKVKASRVDKLQVELNSQRERLEESNRTTAKLKVSHAQSSTHLGLNHCVAVLGI